MQLAALIASLLAGIVQGIPQISAEIKGIVSAISGSLAALLSSGVTTTLNPTTVLAALAGVIAAMKSVPNIPADKLQLIADLENALVAGMAADTQASQKVDPTVLQPITPLP